VVLAKTQDTGQWQSPHPGNIAQIAIILNIKWDGKQKYFVIFVAPNGIAQVLELVDRHG
jgi:hypothetical protein